MNSIYREKNNYCSVSHHHFLGTSKSEKKMKLTVKGGAAVDPDSGIFINNNSKIILKLLKIKTYFGQPGNILTPLLSFTGLLF